MSAVTPISDAPSLIDIPGHLRQLADRIEAGEMSEPTTVTVVVADVGTREAALFAWGPRSDLAHTHYTLTLAAHLLIRPEDGL